MVLFSPLRIPDKKNNQPPVVNYFRIYLGVAVAAENGVVMAAFDEFIINSLVIVDTGSMEAYQLLALG